MIRVLALLFLTSCVDTGEWVTHKDGNYAPAWWDDKRNVQGPSASAPESLKPFYDPELTKKLNEQY